MKMLMRIANCSLENVRIFLTHKFHSNYILINREEYEIDKDDYRNLNKTFKNSFNVKMEIMTCMGYTVYDTL